MRERLSDEIKMKKLICIFLAFTSFMFGCSINSGLAMGNISLVEEKAATQEVWATLVNETNNVSESVIVGCWDPTYWSGTGAPGHHDDFIKWGLRIKTAHPQFFTSINSSGDLIKPGRQDEKHQGTYSIDYQELIRATKEISDNNLLPTIGLFIHNFETVTGSALEKFFAKFSADLKKNRISKVVLIPAWDIQGEWPAWEEGATRDCYIDSTIFNKQMWKIKRARDNANADNIDLGIALAAGFDNKYLNKERESGQDYLEGLRACDIVGINYYPTKEKGPFAAFEDARKLWSALEGQKPVAFFEYSIETYDWINKKNIEWTNKDKIKFIKDSYKLLEEYPFVTQIHWWFIGKGSGARINYE